MSDCNAIKIRSKISYIRKIRSRYCRRTSTVGLVWTNKKKHLKNRPKRVCRWPFINPLWRERCSAPLIFFASQTSTFNSGLSRRYRIKMCQKYFCSSFLYLQWWRSSKTKLASSIFQLSTTMGPTKLDQPNFWLHQLQYEQPTGAWHVMCHAYQSLNVYSKLHSSIYNHS